MKTIDIKSNSRILHWAFYIFLFTVLSVGSVYASEDTPSVLSTNQSEKKTVKGNVMDEYGQPLVGVAVQVKGTSLGVVTDLDGNFSFSIPEVHILPRLLQYFSVSCDFNQRRCKNSNDKY